MRAMRPMYAIGVLLLAASVGVGCSRAERHDRATGYSYQNQYATGQYQDRGATAPAYDRDRTVTSRGDTYDHGYESDRHEATHEGHHWTSDERLAHRVKKTLENDKRTRDLDVDADARGGVVTLTGHANTDRQKRHASEIAKTVKGVKRVKNEIEVGSR